MRGTARAPLGGDYNDDNDDAPAQEVIRAVSSSAFVHLSLSSLILDQGCLVTLNVTTAVATKTKFYINKGCNLP
jgi:hypothetical protein